MQKGFLAIFVVIGVIVALGLITGAFYLGSAYRSKSSTPVAASPLPSSTPETSLNSQPTFAFVNYHDPVNNFEMLYPGWWHIETNGSKVTFIQPPPVECLGPLHGCGGGSTNLEVNNIGNANGLSVADLVKQLNASNTISWLVGNPEVKSVNGIDWNIARQVPGAGPGQEAVGVAGNHGVIIYCGGCNNEFMDDMVGNFKFN